MLSLTETSWSGAQSAGYFQQPALNGNSMTWSCAVHAAADKNIGSMHGLQQSAA